MSKLAESFLNATVERVRLHWDWEPLGAALALGLLYYLGAKIGLLLVVGPSPLSVLWAPNAFLFAALLLAPRRWWRLLILAAFPAHVLAEMQGHVPLVMVLCWFVSNVSEALIGATFMRRFADVSKGLGTVRNVTVFGIAALLATCLSSFLDAGFVRLVGWGDTEYWALWNTRLFSNMLATLTFVPVAITWATIDLAKLLASPPRRLQEAGVLSIGVVAVSFLAFNSGFSDLETGPSLLYLPVPFLAWAALRFGPPMTSTSFAILAFMVIWGAGHGRGPFLLAATHKDVFPIQLFLITIAVPLMLVAAVIEERWQAERMLRMSEALFSTAFRSSPDAIAISRLSDGHIIEANDRWLDLLGFEREELKLGLIAPLAMRLREADRKNLLKLARLGGEIRDVEATLDDRYGITRQVVVRLKPVDLQGQPCAIGIVRHRHRARHHRPANGGVAGARAASAAHASVARRVAHRLFEHARA
jgi:two-component system, LuxR family, sensor kinase FixL